MRRVKAVAALMLLLLSAASMLLPLVLSPLRISSPVLVVKAQPTEIVTGSGASPTFVQMNVTDPSTSAALLQLSSTGSYAVQAGQNASYRIPVPQVNVVPITITERSGNSLTNYAVQIVLDSANFNGWNLINSTNVYFVDASGSPLYYWVESMDTANRRATIWVKVPLLPAGGSVTVYMVYGGPNPYSTYNDPNQVFTFFDSFEGGLIGWSFSGDAGWATTTLRAYHGSYSATNRYIDDNQVACMYRSVAVPTQSLLSFYWSVSSEAKFDFLRFYLNGTERARISGEVPWTYVNYTLPAGTHEIRWCYTKDVSVSAGLDRGFVDLVIVRPYVSPEPAAAVNVSSPAVRILIPAGFSVVNVTRSDGLSVPFTVQSFNATHSVVAFSATPGFSYTVYATARNAVSAAFAQNGYVYFPRGGKVTVYANIADPFGNPLVQSVYFSLYRADTGALVATAVATSNSSGVASAALTLLNADLQYYVRVETNGTYAGLSYFVIYSTSVAFSLSAPSVASKGVPFTFTVSASLTVDGSPVDMIGVNGSAYSGSSVTLSYQFNMSGRLTFTVSVWAVKDAANVSAVLSQPIVVGGSIRWWLYSATANGTSVNITVTALYDDNTTAAGTAVALINGAQAASGGLPITVTLTSTGLFNVTLIYTDVDNSTFSTAYLFTVAQLGNAMVLLIPSGTSFANPLTGLNVTFASTAYLTSFGWAGDYFAVSGQVSGDDSPVTLYVKAENANLTIVQLYKSKTSTFVLSAPSGTISVLNVSYSRQFRNPPQAVRITTSAGQTIIYASSFKLDPGQFAAASPPAVYVDLVNGIVCVKIQHASDVSVDLFWEYGAAAPGQAAQSAVLNFPISSQYVGSPIVFVGAIPQAALSFATTYVLYTGTTKPAYSFPFSSIPATILIFEPAAPAIPSYTVYWNQPSNPYSSYTVSTTSGVFGAYDDFDYPTQLWIINGSYAYAGSLLWLYPNTTLALNATMLPDDSFALFRILVYTANATFVYGYANISLQPDGVYLCTSAGCGYVCNTSPVLVLGFGAYYDATVNKTTYYVLAIDADAALRTAYATVSGNPGAQPFYLYLGGSILALDKFASIYGLYARLLALGQASFSVAGPYGVQTLIKMVSLQTPTIIQFSNGTINVYAGGRTGITFMGFAGFVASISVGAVTMSNVPVTSDVWTVDVPLGYTAMLIVDPVNRVLSLMSASPVQPPFAIAPTTIPVYVPRIDLAAIENPQPSLDIVAVLMYGAFAAVAVAAYVLGADIGMAIAVTGAIAAAIGAATGSTPILFTGIAALAAGIAVSAARR